jgi:two-component system KDP operon response regulator KdpE
MEKKAKILIVEDDAQMAYLLGQELEAEGYDVLHAEDGVEGLQAVQAQAPALVVLDVMMPRMDGWEACRQIRSLSNVPIIMTSCRISEMDKVRGLELGADDYIGKPIGMLEFKARVRAALRRGSNPVLAEQLVEVDERLTVDRMRREVRVEGEPVDLSTTEYKMLNCFLDNAGRVLSHQSLLTQVWGWEYAHETDYLKVYVHHLRKKLEEDPKRPRYILTERGVGYRFQVPGWH